MNLFMCEQCGTAFDAPVARCVSCNGKVLEFENFESLLKQFVDCFNSQKMSTSVVKQLEEVLKRSASFLDEDEVVDAINCVAADVSALIRANHQIPYKGLDILIKLACEIRTTLDEVSPSKLLSCLLDHSQNSASKLPKECSIEEDQAWVDIPKTLESDGE